MIGLEIIMFILKFIIISFLIQISLAAVFILFGKGRGIDPDEGSLDFSELEIDYSDLPPGETYRARNGSELPYRYYPADTDTVIILIHGSGWHSRYFLPMARYLSSEGLARVYTPDLRGHGDSPERRGDVDYIDQLEDDLADFLEVIRKSHPDSRLILGGHSSGASLVIRFAGSRYRDQADAYLLLTPFLKYNAPTMRPNSGGWAYAFSRRIAGLSMLNNMGLHLFDFLKVIEFNLPEEYRDGTETLAYSHRLNTGYAPRNYKKDLRCITRPLLVIAGRDDDAFIPEGFEPVISRYTELQCKLLPGVSHMSVVVGSEVQPVLKDCLEELKGS